MSRAFFVSDLHGKFPRYQKLFEKIAADRPDVVLFGGDLLPHDMAKLRPGVNDFMNDFMAKEFAALKEKLKAEYPEMLVILGNDDGRREEHKFVRLEAEGLLRYISMRKVSLLGHEFVGYPFVPPTPFLRKDWEKYDVSRYVDPGCIPPTAGNRTVEPDYDTEYATIREDLDKLAEGLDPAKTIFLFHSPPYQTALDRAALDGQMVDHVPLDVHVGSIAIQRFIKKFQPKLSLHGHIHESSAITGKWKDRIGNTPAFSAAWNGPELALIDFDLHDPSIARRYLL